MKDFSEEEGIDRFENLCIGIASKNGFPFPILFVLDPHIPRLEPENKLCDHHKRSNAQRKLVTETVVFKVPGDKEQADRSRDQCKRFKQVLVFGRPF